MCSLGSGKHRTPYGDWVIHVPGLGLREHSKPLLGARRKRVLRIAISSGRRRRPVRPVGPPLPRAGPGYTAATSSSRSRSRPGELKAVSRQGPICLLLGGLGGATNYPISVRRPFMPDLRPDPVQARCGTLRRSWALLRESKPSAVSTTFRVLVRGRSAACVP